MSEFVSAKLRREIARRARQICEYCLCPEAYALHTFECEHVVPRSLGGDTASDNLAWSCDGCNRFKAARNQAIDPNSGSLRDLYNPRVDDWSLHFAWSNDYIELIGISAKGRATIQALRLNRPGVCNIRQLLILIDKHPPIV